MELFAADGHDAGGCERVTGKSGMRPRGEYRRALPVGLVWGERAGEIRLHPDEAVTAAIRTVFERFAELGSVRRVWLWFRAEQSDVPAARALRSHPLGTAVL